MRANDVLKNLLIAAGENVFGKRETFPPVVFYLCKNHKGDICTPWALNFTGQGTDPRLVKFIGQGTDPRIVDDVNCENGYINIRLNDSYVIQRINQLAGEYRVAESNEFYPDDSKPSLYRDYMMYLANGEKTWEPIRCQEIPENVRQGYISIIYGDFTGNVEKLPEAIYFLARQGTDPRHMNTLAKAAAVLTGDRPPV